MRRDIQQKYRGNIPVLPLVLERQDYAFALPTHSPLHEGIDTSLPKRIYTPDLKPRLGKCFDDPCPSRERVHEPAYCKLVWRSV